MPKIKAIRRDAYPGDYKANHVRRYVAENGAVIVIYEFPEVPGMDDIVFLHFNGECHKVEGKALDELKNRIDFVEEKDESL